MKNLKIFFVYRIDKPSWGQCCDYIVIAENRECAINYSPVKENDISLFWTDKKYIRTKFLGYATKKYKNGEFICKSWISS